MATEEQPEELPKGNAPVLPKVNCGGEEKTSVANHRSGSVN
jgi:hypothetical protein